MTKAELVNEIAIQTGYDRVSITNIIEASMYTVMKSVGEGENIYLRGFGTFTTKTRKQKLARNITGNTSVIVPEHKIPFFKPAPDFMKEVLENKNN